MGRNIRNAPPTQQHSYQSYDNYLPSPAFPPADNSSNDQLAAINLPLDLDSPALIVHELSDVNAPLHSSQLDQRATVMFNGAAEDLDLDDRAQLVSVSPPPPSALQQQKDLMRDDEFSGSSLGHTRSPILARESTTLESFSRSMRNYVPSSISIPSVAPSPPRVSRPVSFGMMATSSPEAGQVRANDHTKRRGSDASTWDHTYGHGIVNLNLDEVFEEEHDRPKRSRSSSGRGITTYPTTDDDDRIIWSGWDTLGRGSKAQRFLFLGYSSGFQVWDCTNLGSVSEIVNIPGGDGWGRVSFASVLPAPVTRNDKALAPKRPLIGVVSSVDEPELLIYSLQTHETVKKISFPGLTCFNASDRFIVVSTTAPELHIFSASSLEPLYTISSPALIPFVHPPSTSATFSKNISRKSVEASLDYDDVTTNEHQPHPVFALSGRFLAFASPPPRVDSRPTSYAISDPPPHGSSLDGGGGIFIGGMTQNEIGNAAVRVGESVLNSMKALGGMAFNAAKATVKGDHLTPSPSVPVGSGISNLFFSKSAPSTSGVGYDGRRSSPTKERRNPGPVASPSPTTTTTFMNSVITALPTLSSATNLRTLDSYVSVVDLMPLLNSSPQPELLVELLSFRKQTISKLSFSRSGTNLMVVPKDGQTCKVFSIRPMPKTMRRVFATDQQHRLHGASSDNKRHTKFQTPGSNYAEELRSLLNAGLHSGEHISWHLYDLKRGRTSGVIENVDLADDGRWIAISSRKRTVHVFAVNPYGGRADEASHTEGKVRNCVDLPLLSAEVDPIIRIRDFKPPSDSFFAPISFTFIRSTESTLPMNLLPVTTAVGAAISSTPPVTTYHSSPPSLPKPLSPTRLHRPKNFQDMLYFDPLDGVLSLRRLTVDKHTKERSLQFSNAVSVVGGTSRSLPGSGSSLPGKTTALHSSSDIVVKDSSIATWNLRRGMHWEQVKQVVRDLDRIEDRPRKTNWIAQAELSTSSRLPGLRSRSIYLWHQFSFYGLGEDYHALIRRYKLDFPVVKLEVRKEVEVSAYPTGVGEAFVQGEMASPMDIRRAPSSFDEPLASAMSASLGEYANPSLPVLPMLPNGAPGHRFRNPIPIRNVATGISDGMSEGLGRIKREISRVRSPKLNPRTESPAWAPLEFDEEDEDFLLAGNKGDSVSRSTSRDGGSILTPSSIQPDLFEDMQDERGWSQEDRQAVEDEERFYDISPVGFLDEEQVPTLTQLAGATKGRNKKRARKGKDT